jgi:DNA-binding MarR family transcriptional regulator
VTSAAAARSGPAGSPPGLAAAHGDAYECAQAWSALTAAHARISGRLSAALAGRCGLTINDFEILLRLDRAPGQRVRPGELRPGVPLTQPALSRALARLADRGLVRRAGAPADRRGVLIAITPAGRKLLRDAIPVHASVIHGVLLDQLTAEEQEVLARVLSRVAADG